MSINVDVPPTSQASLLDKTGAKFPPVVRSTDNLQAVNTDASKLDSSLLDSRSREPLNLALGNMPLDLTTANAPLDLSITGRRAAPECVAPRHPYKV